MRSWWSFTAASCSSTLRCSFQFISPNWTLCLLLTAKQTSQDFSLHIKEASLVQGTSVFLRTLRNDAAAASNIHSLTDSFQELLLFLPSGVTRWRVEHTATVFSSQLFLTRRRWWQIWINFPGHWSQEPAMISLLYQPPKRFNKHQPVYDSHW